MENLKQALYTGTFIIIQYGEHKIFQDPKDRFLEDLKGMQTEIGGQITLTNDIYFFVCS